MKNILINKDIARLYIKELEELANENNIASGLRATEISKLPEVLNIVIDEDDEDKIWSDLNECLEEALSNFVNMRETEGERIKLDLEERLNEINENVAKIIQNSTLQIFTVSKLKSSNLQTKICKLKFIN